MSRRLKYLLSNKIAIAILGAVLIAGAGSAAALAASGGNLQTPFASHSPSAQHSNGQDDNNQRDGHEAEGTISSIDAAGSRFVVKTELGASVTVVVNSATVFTDGLHSFADLKTGMSVEVDGNPQADGTLTATKVHGDNEGPDDGNDDHGDDNDGRSGSGNSTPGADNHGGSGGHDDGTPHT
jgi:Domain of unknown function (DUF5666)